MAFMQVAQDFAMVEPTEKARRIFVDWIRVDG